MADADDKGVCVADAELTGELELEEDLVAAAEDEGAAVDVAMPDEELKAEGVAVADDEGAAVDEGAAEDEGDSREGSSQCLTRLSVRVVPPCCCSSPNK